VPIWIIDVKVNGKPARLIYDTGASQLALFKQSFPDIEPSPEQTTNARVFGGGQVLGLEKTGPITLTWNGRKIDIPNALFADYNKITPDVNDTPFFEGIFPPLKIAGHKGESVTVFDVNNKNILHLPTGQKVKFKHSKSFKLTRKANGEWRVKMPVSLEGETKKRMLDLIVDTGAGPSLILNRKKFNSKNIVAGHKIKSGGLGGVFHTTYQGRTTFFIGKNKLLIDTVNNKLPTDIEADGYLGWGFLRRFKTAFDFTAGKMIIDLSGADFTNDKIREDNFRIQGFPTSNWNGMHIIGVESWASSGLQSGDILTSIDGIKLTPTAMYSVRRHATATPHLCWRRGDTESCGQVQQNKPILDKP